MNEMIGTTLGHYRIVEQIGAGGMGVVYRAHDERLNRDVAIKVLPEEVARSGNLLARFEREAKLLASFNHPNIATLHGLEEDDERRFLIMELVEGESLSGFLARGALPIDDAITIALQIAIALETAHEHGIIHRDLKPANVMVNTDDLVKVLDFGLAKAFDTEASSPQSPESLAESPTLTADLTRGGVLLGTAAYMSPEQARGKPVDKRADIWAFGCVFYEMLTGTRPFAGTTSTEFLAAIIKEDPDWDLLPSETPITVRRLLRRCLTKDPRDRLHDIADARIEMQSLSTDDDYQDEPAVSASIRAGWRTWLPWGVAGVLAAVLVATVMTEILTNRTREASPSVVRTTIDLPPGTALSHMSFRQWNAPMRNELALSPDGNTLVFSAAAERSPSTARLFRRPMGQLEAEEISGTEGASGPFFSPDGRWIAYWASGELKKVSLDGGLPITLARYRDGSGLFPHMGGSWSPSDTIYIGTHMDGLQTVAAVGGQLEQLTVPERFTEYAHRMPQVLPGERAVLFTVAYDYRGAEGHIEVLSLDSGERRTVIDSGLDARYLPTGHIVFLQQGIVMAAPFDLDRLEVSGRPVPVLEGVTHATNLPLGWANSGAGLLTTADNGTLVFSPGGMAADLRRRFVWVDRNGRIEPISEIPEGHLSTPRFSPDGRWLAFTTRGLSSAVWVHDLNRGTTTRLTNEGRVNHSSWNPNGERIVFGYSQGGVGNLYWRSPRLNEPMERLMTSEYVQQPGSWSPDGRFLAFVQWLPFEGPDIWIFDMKTQDAAPFLQTDHKFECPDFSPDGRWLAYSSRDSRKSEIWVTSFPSRERHLLVSSEGGNEPLWSPDGTEIYYLLDNRLMAVDVKAGQGLSFGRPRTLFEFEGAGSLSSMPVRGYDITPDGTKFIFTESVEPRPMVPPVRQLQVVLNWFEELNRLVPTE